MEKRPRKHPLILPPSGGYEKLVSFKVAKLLYDVTVRFIDRYIPIDSRTHDQMEQAARSGARNIAEGSVISATSKKLEMNLTNVARASVDELRKDYESYLEHRKLPLWAKMDPRRKELSNARCKDPDAVARWIKAIWTREQNERLAANEGAHTVRTPRTVRERAYAELSANVGHTLCMIVLHLTGNQVNSQAEAFEKEGGFSERLYRVRKELREKQTHRD